MGKHEPMSAKAIANKIKAKGLQKIKYYCQMCKKQCRDANGFKCHIMSESHQRQALVVGENPEQFVDEFSELFMEGFMHIVRARYKSSKVLANTVFQEYIKDKEHIHMNGTRWTSLTEFANWLGERGLVTVGESERGIMITYIDRDPETLRRKELDARREQQKKEEADRKEREIKRQKEAAERLCSDFKQTKPEPAPIPFMKIETIKSPVEMASELPQSNNEKLETPTDEADAPSTSCDKSNDNQVSVVERPMFGVQAITLKTMTTTTYKPPKRRKLVKKSDAKKKIKT